MTLKYLTESAFVGSEKDFSREIAVIDRLLTKGSEILDYGCSWGYGAWQFKNCGFESKGLEISIPRANYATNFLEIDVVSENELVKDSLDCVWSSHVIEHLPKPSGLITLAYQVLKPGGILFLKCPNGSSESRALNNKWSQIWGNVHPQVIDELFLRKSLKGKFSGLITSYIGELDHFVQSYSNSKEKLNMIFESIPSFSLDSSEIYFLGHKLPDIN
ncbi:bifunctional 2-polyprenyl-6-hydroxyphenol methylase/3-demethylubiquinol 3-O-methyltransferase UbiG [Synechocystis sp. PCC 7338]|uniref:class I SAM-dependent methyltransferase n=1 Tax=Synechocystis sp. PCC 7338 TaxID=2732530 RepID=UPI001BAEDBD4|nr:class I SAM-dependent methyltransferase [Synechocystis sp. PCC 7338]QUS59988.1 class I SAM-dependent methyltransferase [Synechocystis sp. PCC 7338]